MKEADYRSAYNYLNAAKRYHVKLGHKWNDSLDMAAREYSLSTRRGLGPCRQSEPLPFEKLMEKDFGKDPIVDGGPVGPGNALTMFTYFIVRGVEGSMAQTRDVRLDPEDKTVHWRLSVSKTDPAALGCERRWGCLCGEARGLGCPYHAAADQMELLCALFGERVEAGDLPFFPDANGSVVTKDAMESFVDELARLGGQPLTLPSGAKRFGKHSFRSTGAVLLSRLGLEVYKIQLLARWGSDVVLHYVRESPLETITKQVRGAIADKTVTDLVAKLAGEVDTLKKGLAAMDDSTAHLLRLEAELSQLKSKQDEDEAKGEGIVEKGSYIINPITGKCHKALVYTGLPRFWKTRCSWQYGLTHYEPRDRPLDGYKLLCDTCLHHLREFRNMHPTN
mgnify:CR=1 FL=1